jgi:hypothetical protein
MRRLYKPIAERFIIITTKVILAIATLTNSTDERWKVPYSAAPISHVKMALVVTRMANGNFQRLQSPYRISACTNLRAVDSRKHSAVPTCASPIAMQQVSIDLPPKD